MGTYPWPDSSPLRCVLPSDLSLSVPQSPLVFPYLEACGNTAELQLPGSASTLFSVDLDVNSKATFPFEAGFHPVVPGWRANFSKLAKTSAWLRFFFYLFFWLILFYGDADESAKHVLAESGAKQHLHKSVNTKSINHLPNVSFTVITLHLIPSEVSGVFKGYW